MAQRRYQVIERIDSGGMAEVFKANSTSLDGFQKLVAIKRVLPSLTKNERFVRMFLDEAKVSLHLNHTNVVQVFELGIADGIYFIVMEYVDGTNLKRLIEELARRQVALPLEQGAYIALEMCKGLAHAHEKLDQGGRHLAIVHRDVSPPNVLLSREGEVKITDFGLAKAKSQVETTDPGVVKGKFGYLSPEAAYGEQVDERTDIFAVGIVLWEMLAGRRLFLGKTDFETLKMVRAAKVPPVSVMRVNVPPQLDHILRRSLTPDLDERYRTARDMGSDLAEFLYEYGRPVTSFDISGLIAKVVDLQAEQRASAADAAAQEAVQREINQIVTLDEIGDLDNFLATHASFDVSDERYSGGSPLPDGQYEDPRMWADFSFAEDDASSVSTQPSDHRTPAPPATQTDSWKEESLDSLTRQMEAIRISDEMSLEESTAVDSPDPNELDSDRAPKNPAPWDRPEPSEPPPYPSSPSFHSSPSIPQTTPADPVPLPVDSRSVVTEQANANALDRSEPTAATQSQPAPQSKRAKDLRTNRRLVMVIAFLVVLILGIFAVYFVLGQAF